MASTELGAETTVLLTIALAPKNLLCNFLIEEAPVMLGVLVVVLRVLVVTRGYLLETRL